MAHYPVFLELTGRRCLVVGLGRVGRRKLEGLLECGPAQVTGLDIRPPDSDIQRLLDSRANFSFLQRPFRAEDVLGQTLVFACSSDAGLNAEVAETCRLRGVWCNVADDPDQSDFILPSLIRRGDLVVAVSTSGRSPALARMVRQELDEMFGPGYEPLLTVMGRIREGVLSCGTDCDQNRDLFRALVGSELRRQLEIGDLAGADRTLRQVLPEVLHPEIGVYLHGSGKNF
ncbi:MAG: bifunctional precorrin-2 dehydrogenase/sirohydrochlorin ferrochelatase [Deltaproteobacteria bacterium]|nr:bifunctional precorrin-2 dehydrogenase/sirohydrochlorin ferrochelatase [Deltaproteobacteria bacterium]